ncbi:MAG: glycosyltransferase family 4 protein [Desulfuromonadales bacterium]|nr:glycosyltransferase family 4 protein [Desulfuromonadales bacterium]
MAEVSSKLKILQVTAALNEGGVERGTLEMAAFTIAQGAKSYVASNGGKLVSELERTGGKHFLLPLARRNPLSIIFCAFQLIKIIRNYEIDLVHARSRAPAWAALIACRLTKSRMLTTFHGTHKIQNKFKWFYNSVMVRGERVIAISEFLRDHIIDKYKVEDNRIDVAPRGFDPSEFNPDVYDEDHNEELKSSLGIKSEEKIISLPGRLTRLKGQVDFLKALARVKDLPWQALLIGGAGKKSAYESELKKLAKDLDIDERVHFLGSQSDIARYYAVSDLVVSASIVPEAFGRVAVEAQAMATPVIASAHGGSLETVQDGRTGWLYSPANIDEMSEKIRYFLTNEIDLKEVGTAGRAWVSENYTTEKMCQAEWGVYMSLLAPKCVDAFSA